MSYSMKDLLAGAQMFSKSVFGQKKEYSLQFNHEKDGLWYVDFPGWPFDHHNLMMVRGADELCAFLSDDDKNTYVNVIPANQEEDHPGYAMLVQKEHSLTGGSTYEVTGLEGFERDIWLCPVTLFALGQYPKYIYVKKAERGTSRKGTTATNVADSLSDADPETSQPETMASIYHLIVLDESGSMSGVTHQTITGCNETIQSVRSMQAANPATQKHFVSIYLFDSVHSRYIIQNKAIDEVKEITAEDYRPNACTPLFDALGHTLTDMKELMNQPETLGYVTIITDGYENASRRYTLSAVRELIRTLKSRNVIFTFIGANIDAEAYAKGLDIQNSMQFTQDDEGMKQMWAKEKRSKMRSMAKMSYERDFVKTFHMCGFADKDSQGYYDETVDASRIAEDHITELKENEIFVFGSNPDGNHSGGAAALAVVKFGAKMGQAEGLQGQSYAIPTDGVDKRQLNEAIGRFCTFAAEHPELTFLVTSIGCGAAGWSAYDVAPMFQKVASLRNVKLPKDFCDFISF